MMLMSWFVILAFLAGLVGMIVLFATSRSARRVILGLGLAAAVIIVFGLVALFILRSPAARDRYARTHPSTFSYPPALESDEVHAFDLGNVPNSRHVASRHGSRSVVVDGSGVSMTDNNRSLHVSRDGGVAMNENAVESVPSATTVAPAPSAAPQPVEATGTGSPSDEWIDASQADFEADIYPSERSAAIAAARQMVKGWERVLPAGQEPTQVLVSGDSELEPNVVPAVIQTLRSKLGDARVEPDKTPQEQYLEHVEKKILPYYQQSQGNAPPTSAPALVETDATVHVLIKGDFSYAYGGKGVAPSLKKGGRISIEYAAAWPAFKGSGGASFENKPWVEHDVDPASQVRGYERFVSRSRRLCATRSEAQEQVIADAATKLIPLVRTALERLQAGLNQKPQPGVFYTTQDRPDDQYRDAIRAEMLRSNGISEQFTQQLRKPYGEVWQHAALIDASDEQITRYARMFLPQIIKERKDDVRKREAWVRTSVGIALMTILIAVVYAFLNAATRGYYTWMLRGSMVILVLAGAVLLLFMA